MLALARLYLATVQTGYIHPDEFHQSVQVMARDILDIDAGKPWEFHANNPIRSVTFSAVVSLPFVFLRLLAPVSSYLFGYDLLTPTTLLVAPRVFMTLLSFIADYSMYRIAQLCYLRPWSCVEVFASSYVMLVYATRTFSNTLELILMAVLLWRVCESMVDSTKIIKKENILQDLYESAETVQEKVKLVRMKSKLPPYNFVDSGIISAVVTYGSFVRPTFVVFSFVPVAYWLQRGVVTREVSFSYFNLRFLSLLPGAVVTFLTCVLVDSFYYGALTTTELVFWNVTSGSFVVTPINFLLYNTQSKNLAQHGLHPHYLHLLVNVPLLYGVLGLLGLWSVSKYFVALTMGAMTKKPRVFSLATMLLASFITPVLVLSLMPHQEARFLLPTLPPLVLLHSDDVLILTARRIRPVRHFLFLAWHVWNILCVAFFGFLHQGGVTKAVTQVHHHALQRPPLTDSHVLFSAMYTPPTFMLARRLPVTAQAEDGRHYRIEKSVFTYDTGGSRQPTDLYRLAAKVHRQARQNTTREVEVLVCLPASLSEGLHRAAPENVTLERLQRVRGHLTLEDPPDLSLAGVTFTSGCGKLCHFLRRLDQFSIDIISINFGPRMAEDSPQGLQGSLPPPSLTPSVPPHDPPSPEASPHNLTDEDEEEDEFEDDEFDEEEDEHDHTL
ncbi:GPI mannosyltransferase 4-like isoform X2 [Eriocheir sinensis]|nr:GPI mannosyltransferase 4-like isoform X2 [Eriocheir sinensis]